MFIVHGQKLLLTVTIHCRPTPTILTSQTTHGHLNRLVGFLITGQGYFTFLYQHTKYTTQEVEENKNNHELGLAPSARTENSVTLLCILCFCGLMRACTRAKLPKATSNANLSSRVVQPGFCWTTVLSSCLSDFCWLVSSLPCSHLLTELLLTALSCRLSLGPPFPHLLPVSWEISRTWLCVGFAPKQRDPLTGPHTHRNECQPSCHITLKLVL